MTEKNYTVVEEYSLTNFNLFQIAQSNDKMIYKDGARFAIRFLLKSSFKAKNSNHVVNNYAMQIIAIGKDKPFTPDMVQDRVKIQKQVVVKEKIVKDKPREQQVEIGESKEL